MILGHTIRSKRGNSPNKRRRKTNLDFPFPCLEDIALVGLIILRAAIKLECFNLKSVIDMQTSIIDYKYRFL